MSVGVLEQLWHMFHYHTGLVQASVSLSKLDHQVYPLSSPSFWQFMVDCSVVPSV